MTTYYVRKTGNDTTGNGSSATPWLTIMKAELTISAAAHTILVGDGVYEETYYAENWYKPIQNGVTVSAENGAAGDVTIKGATGGTAQGNIAFFGASGRTFNNIKFLGLATQHGIRLYGFDGVTFNNCTITVDAGKNALTADGNAIANLTCSGCTINGKINIYNNAANSNVAFTNCTVVCSAGCVAVAGSNTSFAITGLSFTNCNFSGASANIVSLGVDGSAGYPVTGTITNCVVANTGVSGHAVILGAGCTDCVVDGLNISQCVDYALVLKAHGSDGHGTEVKNCRLSAPTSDILCKGASYPNIHDNTLTGIDGSGALQVSAQIAILSDHVTFQYNTIKLTSASSYIFKWGTSAADAGGGVCDYNIYKPVGTRWGDVYGTLNIASLAGLQAAWAAYDVTTNDSHSRLWHGSTLLKIRGKWIII